MFSALKKLASKNEGTGSAIPESVGQSMSDSLKKKFARGVQFNMKVIIKGDRNVGKSCLLERLQGKAFLEQYTPTEQIQVASIQWSFKATDDIVKVEVWDVVDRGKVRPRSSGLKIGNMGKSEDVPVLDAEFLDVYKGTHCVVLMMDITKAWTFDYVCRELPKIPKEIPVLLLGNHCDMGHHRVITKDQVNGLIEEVGKERPSEILYGESSMRNGFGLRLLHKFLGIPFLYLQKATLEASLKKNIADTEICRFEITEFNNSVESDYSTFMDKLINKRRQGQHPHKTVQSPTSSDPSLSPLDFKPTKSIIIGAGHPIIIPDKTSSSAVSTTVVVNTTKLSSPSPTVEKSVKIQSPVLDIKPTLSGNISNVDEFCPEGGDLDRSFLDDAVDAARMIETVAVESDSDDDSRHNPLVARFDDDVAATVQEDTLSRGSSQEKEKNLEKNKKNPLIKSDKTLKESELKESIERKLSLSSFEIENSTSNNFSLEEYENWSLDTKLRRSPEGGEDIVSTNSSHIVLDGDESVDVKEKKHKKKKSSKEKGEHREKKKKSKKKDNIEDFLNEMKSNPEETTAAAITSDTIDEAYEAI